MCGASLVEPEELEQEEGKDTQRLPGWVGSVLVVVLASAILAGGGFGLYRMLGVEPEPVPTSPTVTPSSTPTPTETPIPTDTPMPTATPTPPPPHAHTVQDGETVSDIALAYDVTVDEILALNPSVDPEFINAGQVLLVPAAEPTPFSPGTATTDAFIVHVVSMGETLISIAEDYDVPVSLIRTANDLSQQDETIRAGQSLVVPLSTPTSTSTPMPTSAPNVTSMTPSPYAPPPLLYPPDGMVFEGGEAPVLLQWASIGVLQAGEWYELSLSLVGGDVLTDTIRTRATAWRVPLDLVQGGSEDARRFEWRVRVVREVEEDAYEEAGAPSQARSFVWQGLSPTVTPTVTP